MALECLAILGPKNEPLYLTATKTGDTTADDDAFGFLDQVSSQRNGFSFTKTPSIRHEVSCSHTEFAACERWPSILCCLAQIHTVSQPFLVFV